MVNIDRVTDHFSTRKTVDGEESIRERAADYGMLGVQTHVLKYGDTTHDVEISEITDPKALGDQWGALALHAMAFGRMAQHGCVDLKDAPVAPANLGGPGTESLSFSPWQIAFLSMETGAMKQIKSLFMKWRDEQPPKERGPSWADLHKVHKALAKLGSDTDVPVSRIIKLAKPLADGDSIAQAASKDRKKGEQQGGQQQRQSGASKPSDGEGQEGGQKQQQQKPRKQSKPKRGKGRGKQRLFRSIAPPRFEDLKPKEPPKSYQSTPPAPGMINYFSLQPPAPGRWAENDIRWAPMKIHDNVALDGVNQIAKRALRRKPSMVGSFRYPLRALIPAFDGAAFGLRRKVKGGTLLVDVSGSMSLSETDIMALIEQRPAMTIALYGGGTPRGARRGDSMGSLVIVANNGRYAKGMDREHYNENGSFRAKYGLHGSNLCDGPALDWLSLQKAPRFWIGDGAVTGIYEVNDPVLAAHCAVIVKRAKITQFFTIEDFLLNRNAHRKYATNWHGYSVPQVEAIVNDLETAAA